MANILLQEKKDYIEGQNIIYKFFLLFLY